MAPSDLPRALHETTTPPAYSAVDQHTVAVALQVVPAVNRTTPPTLLASLHASCRPPSLSLSISHHCHCHVAHPVFDSHSEPPSLPSCHARRPSNLPCARAPARQSGFFFPSHQHGQMYDSSPCIALEGRQKPQKHALVLVLCCVRSSALGSQIVNTRPL